MIEKLTVKNVFSFRDLTEFSFLATSERARPGFEHIKWYTVSNRKKLLKAVFLFGNNGAGKSNFLEAIQLLRLFVLKRRDSKSEAEETLPTVQFKFESKYRALPSTISIIIHVRKKRYTYTIAWNSKAILLEHLQKQTGIRPDETVFRRTYDEEKDLVQIDFAPKLKWDDDAQEIIRENVIRNTSVVSIYSHKNMYAPELADLYDYFDTPYHLIGLEDYHLDLCRMLNAGERPAFFHDMLIRLLDSVGSNIRDYKVDRIRRPLNVQFAKFLQTQLTAAEYHEQYPDNMETTRYLRFAHFNNDAEEDPKDPYVWLTESEESKGTLNMIRLIIILFDTAFSNSIATIDECELSIHQETFNRIIQFYLSISEQSQVFFATQALPILEMQGFRRDSARFFDKDFQTGVSSVESVDLSKFHANKNIYKNYVDHAFGGTPKVPEPEEWARLLGQFREEVTHFTKPKEPTIFDDDDLPF